MKKSEYLKEKARRESRDSIFKCLCGAILIGRTRDYDRHLEFDCPVYQEAQKILHTKART